MIYFPVYANMKKNVFHEGRQGKVLSLGELLISAGIGGVPAGESSFVKSSQGVTSPLKSKETVEDRKYLFFRCQSPPLASRLVPILLCALLTIIAWLTTPPDVAKVCALYNVSRTTNNLDSTSVASSSGRNSIQGYNRCHSYHCS